jgi:hypothetical protein
LPARSQARTGPPDQARTGPPARPGQHHQQPPAATRQDTTHAALTTSDIADWRITFRDIDQSTKAPISHIVKAVYPTRDDVLEGWTLLKDHRHKIVYMVRDDVAAAIERISEPAAATP